MRSKNNYPRYDRPPRYYFSIRIKKKFALFSNLINLFIVVWLNLMNMPMPYSSLNKAHLIDSVLSRPEHTDDD